jgi:ketosteroid isomerase-like protein
LADVSTENQIHELVDRETRAWDTQDVPLLLSVFHPDMVWAWPVTYTSVDPIDWRLRMGRFDERRWGDLYRELFNSRELLHNRRETIRIEVSEEHDGGLAIVDIDTLWRDKASGEEDHWLGRTCKLYVLTPDGWKMTSQVGALRYEERG